MRIVHLYPKDNDFISRYVSMLPTSVDDGGLGYPDILHVHGCWHGLASFRQASTPRQRVVITPHGELQSWMLSEHRSQQLLERRRVAKAYALVAMGRQEADELRQLGWNPRIETIAHPLVTKTTTAAKLAEQHVLLYRKVMDSYVHELMNNATRQALRTLLKAGITGDRRWISGLELPAPQWRLLLLYAWHEGVADLVERGISVAGLQAPTLDAAHTAAYLPPDYQPPTSLSGQDITTLIGSIAERPTLRHLADLDIALRQPNVEDDKLAQQLDDAHLKQQASRLMQLLAEQTALDEGYMPLPPLDDKQTQALRRRLAEHLKL